MLSLKSLITRVGTGIALGALCLGTDLAAASAKEIEVDDVSITAAATREGRSSYVPWSGIWWPFTDLNLAIGWNGTGADFEYNPATKQWERKLASKPVNDQSPLLKYEALIVAAGGQNPGAALLECQGDEAEDFEHSVYGDKKAKYDQDGVSYSWWGHCNGWCGAALMEKEPIAPIEARGIRFEVADLKGLLSESYWGVQSDFTGRRYNKPKQIYIDGRQPGKDLLAALNSQTPKPVAEYIAWYEKVWETTMTDAAKAAAKPEDFRDELTTFDTWYADSYEKAFADVNPDVFHKILETVIGRKKLALVFDITANEEVWNHPAFAFRSEIRETRSFTENNVTMKEWAVTTTVWYATDGVSQSVLGIEDFTKVYTYNLVTKPDGKIARGEWTGSSVSNHPDFAWLPTYNPTGVDYGENFKLLYGKIVEILPLDHASTGARAIDLGANGTRASTRRGNDRTTTWAEPVAASGDVALTVAVASGRSVAKVKYFEQRVNGAATNSIATRDPLTALGESSTGPAFSVTARFTTAGKKMVIAYAYDSANKLVGFDEITVQYTVSGGGGGTTGGTDDTYEPNDTKAAAATVAAGSFPNLQCNNDDWFKVTLTATSDVTFTIDFQNSEGDLDLTLEGPSGQLGSSAGTGNRETITKTGLAAGTYQARVFGYNGAKAKYAMTVAVVASSTGGGGTPGDDSFEPNNDRASAKAIPTGTTSNLKCMNDDWYKVTVATTSTLTVKISFRNSEGDLDLFVYNASGTEIGKSESVADTETVTKTSLAAGTYTFKVVGYNGARAAYSATVTITPSTTPTTRTGTVTASSLNIRSGPRATAARVTTLAMGRVVTILEERNGFYRITWSGAPTSPTGQLWASKTYIRVN